MNNKIISFGNNAFIAGLFMVACSMAISKFGMSLGQFFILGGWLLSADFSEKWKRLKLNKAVVILLISLFAIHLIGLIHTSDFHYAFNDIRIKLPLLLMPVLILSMPALTITTRNYLFHFFNVSVLISTLISFIIYLGWTSIPVNDIRDISPFISHIRLALLVCVAMVLLYEDFKNYRRWMNVVLFVWFLFFLVLIQSLTGIIIIGIFVFIALIIYSIKKNNAVLTKSLSVLGIIGIITTGVYFYKTIFINSIQPIHVDESQLLKHTPRGNTYYSLLERQDVENGHPVWINICDKELDESWKERTGFSVYDNNRYGYWYYYSVIRFLSSKGWNKDRDAVMSLSQREIDAIKNGCSNVEYMESNGLGGRIKNLAWEYRQYYFNREVSGQSFTQRLAYWSTGLEIFKNNWLLGVGTGDVNIAFKEQYEKDKSKLEEKWRLHTHNQYITLGIAFGVSGIVLLVLVLFYPLIISYKNADFIFSSFILIAALSMLSEDTLETQAGITFFAFLYCLFWRERSVQES
ncbi:MAG: O-antigen ligase family protein [Bacteroidota bacterium]